MLELWKALNGQHNTTAQYVKGGGQERRQLAADEVKEGVARAFQAYGRPLDMITSFKYLGRVLTNLGGDWLAVVGDLRKAQKRWARLSRILGREGARTKVLGVFFKAVVQAVILFGLETWVVTPRMGQALGVSNTGS